MYVLTGCVDTKLVMKHCVTRLILLQFPVCIYMNIYYMQQHVTHTHVRQYIHVLHDITMVSQHIHTDRQTDIHTVVFLDQLAALCCPSQ